MFGWLRAEAGLRFLNEAPFVVLVGGTIVRQYFQRDEPIELRVAALVDHAHAAFANLLEDGVMQQGLPKHVQSL